MSQTFKPFRLPLLGGFALMLLLVHAQDDQSGFISIDCGLAGNSSYAEKATGIKYIADETFIDTGERKSVLPEYSNRYQQPYTSLRSFPEGNRNCYEINVTDGYKYLIRSSFVYGNYDGQNKVPEFDLHLGANLWRSVKLESASTITHKELIHVPGRNYIHVCLVNTGSGVPFISALEIRPLSNGSYRTEGESLALDMRFDTGQNANLTSYRYPHDAFDRIWNGYYDNDWTQLITTSTIDNSKPFQPPEIVLRTAATPKNKNGSLEIRWLPSDNVTEYYVYMHFSEVEKLPGNHSRQMYINREGEFFYKLPVLEYLSIWTVYSIKAQSNGGQYNFSIFKIENSTLPPILNAIEFYMVKEFLESETNQADVDAIKDIKSTYKIKKNWQGDPCVPQAYLWEGLNCSYPENESPRIISLDLSSSGLTGEIATSISTLEMIHTLDLSNNNLIGPIPNFMSQLPNLNVLNLEKNKLTGSVPIRLIDRNKSGLLSLSLCENPNLSGAVSCKRKKNNFVIPLLGSIVGISVLLLCAAAAWWGFKRKRHEAKDTIGTSVESTKRQFTYSEIIKITNNFKRILGKGGFGNVYHGYIDDTQLAIKMLSPSSVQGFRQFLAEVDLLLRVHHKNLTSLVGYCNDKTGIGLVYEYMSSGNLHAHLFSGSSSNILTWKDRLQIAIDAAQGLEYLHYGCKPPIIHRDVKLTNILLNENFQAKLSDFGLSRTFPSNDDTHVSTVVAGTPGYLDPEYNLSNRLNEKSDVYSFGVVLLEIISCRPVYSSREHERIHISRWVSSMLAEGDIYGIVDPRLKGSFNVNSVWKAAEIATACTSADAIKRPTMSESCRNPMPCTSFWNVHLGKDLVKRSAKLSLERICLTLIS
ncbi:putative leucine-rich repeat receptor-like protein kinase At2g19210 [Prunus avium]|uniref:Leucine-rich repeat receptor-like protein kinase At2g19210 n=1 Tax=Prunus avium TaxID=42229 RepID=A0A6P5U4G8_PRUAV|nr:putative leucine-rich repeat receptor-like protein kinase At2g19210 [Prunus avium]